MLIKETLLRDQLLHEGKNLVKLIESVAALMAVSLFRTTNCKNWKKKKKKKNKKTDTTFHNPWMRAFSFVELTNT